MTMPVFQPAHLPSADGTTLTMKPRIRQTQFGDAYVQRKPDGLNFMLEVWQVAWAALPAADAKAITDFFVARGGWQTFRWTAPGSSLQKVYLCPEWSDQFITGLVAVSASFQECIDWSP